MLGFNKQVNWPRLVWWSGVFPLAIVFLTGCAFSTLDDGLPHLVGRNVNYAISYLGIPENEQNIAGKKVYTWTTSSNVTFDRPVTSYSSGTVYSGYGAPAMYSGSTTSYVPETSNWHCTIKVIANQHNIITNTQWSGNLGGCERYSSAIQRLINDNPQHHKDCSQMVSWTSTDNCQSSTQ